MYLKKKNKQSYIMLMLTNICEMLSYETMNISIKKVFLLFDWQEIKKKIEKLTEPPDRQVGVVRRNSWRTMDQLEGASAQQLQQSGLSGVVAGRWGRVEVWVEWREMPSYTFFRVWKSWYLQHVYTNKNHCRSVCLSVCCLCVCLLPLIFCVWSRSVMKLGM